MARQTAISSMLSRCLYTSRKILSPLLRKERKLGVAPGISQRFSTSTAIEDPITPPVQANYTQLLINGQFVDAASGKTFPTLDPRTGEVIAHMAEGDAEDIDRAVKAARKAFDEGPWPKMPAYV